MIDITAVIDIIQLLIVVVALYLMYRSVPSDQVAELIDKVDRQAQITPNKIDDVLVDIARLLNELRQQSPPTVQLKEGDADPAG